MVTHPEAGSAVGLVSPGEMGAAVGAALVSVGHVVLWASGGRSVASSERAARARLTTVGDAAELHDRCAVILSVVPPHAALDTARVHAGFRGMYIDANAVSPSTAAQIMRCIQDDGGTAVDGGIIGPPPTKHGQTRLYLSGPGAPAASRLFDGSVVEAVVLDGDPTAASALKMTYAAMTKGAMAMLLATNAVARELGVDHALEDEWKRSRPGMLDQLTAAREAADKKGWRWTAEMEEIRDTFDSVGKPSGFHQAAADVFRSWE